MNLVNRQYGMLKGSPDSLPAPLGGVEVINYTSQELSNVISSFNGQTSEVRDIVLDSLLDSAHRVSKKYT